MALDDRMSGKPGKKDKLTHEAPALPTSPVIESMATMEKVSWLVMLNVRNKVNRRMLSFCFMFNSFFPRPSSE